MQYLAIIVSFLAAAVAAKACNRGGSYCGTSLLYRGNYRDKIVSVLEAREVPVDERHILNSRFDCLKNGEIAWREYCSAGCGATTTHDPDYCL